MVRRLNIDIAPWIINLPRTHLHKKIIYANRAVLYKVDKQNATYLHIAL